MTITADSYCVCANCGRLRVRPPGGLYGTTDVVCEVCREGYAILDIPVTADALALELHLARLLIRGLTREQ